MSTGETVSTVLVALIGAGLLNFARDGIKALVAGRRARTPEARESYTVAAADESLLVVAKARDELEKDNARLRAERTEEDRRHAVDRETWALEKVQLRSEIDALEVKLRGLLDEFTALKSRHAVP